jgi:hypothetical protein
MLRYCFTLFDFDVLFLSSFFPAGFCSCCSIVFSFLPCLLKLCYFDLSWITRLWSQDLLLQGKCWTPWAMPPSLFDLLYFSDRLSPISSSCLNHKSPIYASYSAGATGLSQCSGFFLRWESY